MRDNTVNERQTRRPKRVAGTITFIRLAGFYDRTAYPFDSNWRQPILCQNQLCEGGTLSLSDALTRMEESGLLVPGSEETFACTGHERLSRRETRRCMHGW